MGLHLERETEPLVSVNATVEYRHVLMTRVPESSLILASFSHSSDGHDSSFALQYRMISVSIVRYKDVEI